MKSYRVVTPVEHDQERFDAGSTIALADAAAAPLLAVGAIAGPVVDLPVTPRRGPSAKGGQRR